MTSLDFWALVLPGTKQGLGRTGLSLAYAKSTHVSKPGPMVAPTGEESRNNYTSKPSPFLRDKETEVQVAVRRA